MPGLLQFQSGSAEPFLPVAGHLTDEVDNGLQSSKTAADQCPFKPDVDSKCPATSPEHDLILQETKILADTGCTAQICQGAKMMHSKETKVGESRSLKVVKEEASAFLWELQRDGIYTEQEYHARLDEVFAELDLGAVEEMLWEKQQRGFGTTSTWTQTNQELLHGVRLAWKNSRRCIMRSHWDELQLCDLRAVTTSAGMVSALLENLENAYGGGKIVPTVFVFPPRQTKGTGPMFISQQVLSFAGYRQPDGSVLGDPANIDLTDEIVELGWTPPELRSRWDFLPLVAMAEGDAPAMTDIPHSLGKHLKISHPDYVAEFEKLDLRWGRFPALSRFGFDIGGVQYTAAPFIGWFMDAEIGVRNLSDPFRYDVLPSVVEAIGFDINAYRKQDAYKSVDSIDDLPDYEQLRWKSKAQAELNYAVRWSFQQEGVSCIGTLAASTDWCRFDDDHFREKGYRLNADPYWIAPPQGSIIPVWHRGGAPNYQPKPLITKHRFDPVKVWHRRKVKSNAPPLSLRFLNGTWHAEVSNITAKTTSSAGAARPKLQEIVDSRKRLHVYFCSTGTTALKLAEKLRQQVLKVPTYHLAKFDSLNIIDVEAIKPDEVILIIASTTGNGTLPANGRTFENKWPALRKRYHSNPFEANYSVFGVGDSGYGSTYNAASIALNALFSDLGAKPIAGGLAMGDVAMETLPTTAFDRWWEHVQSNQNGAMVTKETPEDCFHDQDHMIRDFQEALVVAKDPPMDKILSLQLDLQGISYKVMDHLRVLPSNSQSKVKRALDALGVANTQQVVSFHDFQNPPTFQQFLADFVDLEGHFKHLKWLRSATPDEGIRKAAVIEVLELYNARGILGDKNDGDFDKTVTEVCLDMPLLRPRTFSVASAPGFLGTNIVELLIRFHTKGRLSDVFLSDLHAGDKVKFCVMPSAPGLDIIRLENRPLIAIATGSGFAPIRGLLQRRFISINAGRRLSRVEHDLSFATAQPELGLFHASPLSLFTGYKAEDREIFEETLITGRCGTLVDELVMVPSNPEKTRVQDVLEGNAWVRSNLAEAAVYVCGAESMVRSTAKVLSRMLGAEVQNVLGSRYVEEVF